MEGDAVVQVVIDGPVVPQPLRDVGRAARRNQDSVEFHGLPPCNEYLSCAMSGWYRVAPGAGPGDDGLHDLDRAVAYLKAQHVAQALLHEPPVVARVAERQQAARSEEHTSELQSLMRISYAVFCLKKKKQI